MGSQFISADNNTGKSGIIAATHFAAKFRPPPVKLSWVNVGSPSNLRNNRIGRKRTSNKVDLLRITPPPPTLRTRKYSDLPQCRFLAPVLALVLTSTRSSASAR